MIIVDFGKKTWFLKSSDYTYTITISDQAGMMSYRERSHADCKPILFISLFFYIMENWLWNYTANKYTFGATTMELITNEADSIVAYRVLSSPDFSYGTFVTLLSNQLVQC